MKKIYKYQIPFGDESTVQMPKGASILKVGIQSRRVPDPAVMSIIYPNICAWAIVDTEAELEERKFRIVGTGHPLPDYCVKYAGIGNEDYDYFDSVFDRDFVWHIFVKCSEETQ